MKNLGMDPRLTWALEYGMPLLWDERTGPPTPFMGRDNYSSATDCNEQITGQIQKLLEKGTIAGPFTKDEAKAMGLAVSPVGAVPKKGTEEMRMILDLSVHTNWFLQPMECPLPTIEDPIRIAKKAGIGCKLIKIDLEKGFFQIPVHPEHQYMLAFMWNDQFYKFKFLPFGLNASPGLFCWVTREIKKILWKRMLATEVYVDDFIIIVRKWQNENEVMQLAHSTFEELGVLINPKKTEGPSTKLNFVGINIDTVKQAITLPPEKLQDITEVMNEIEGKKKVPYRLYMRLVGKLSFAAKCIMAGRSFIRRMWDTLCHKAVKWRRGKKVKLDKGFWLDFKWWRNQLTHLNTHRNGVSFWKVSKTDLKFDLEVATDASGYGLGAVWEDKSIQMLWGERKKEFSINWKELRTVIVAAEKWGALWKHQRVLIHSDNMTTVSLINHGSSKLPHLMKLVRRMHELAGLNEFEFKAVHIRGKDNILPDHLSRIRTGMVLE